MNCPVSAKPYIVGISRFLFFLFFLWLSYDVSDQTWTLTEDKAPEQ